MQAGIAATGSTLLPVRDSLAEEAAVAPKGKQPYLVFIYGEGHRWDCLSAAGYPIVKTPNHDRIGNGGFRFENAFCTNALCAPAVPPC